MKVIVFGATGKAGRCLVEAGIDYNYQITAFVRSKTKLLAILGEKANMLKVIEGDALDEKAVAQAINGHDTLINAAAHAKQAEIFEAICRNIVTQAEKYLSSPKRVWLFGGLPGLTVPHTKVIGCDLPLMPSIFKSHKANYQLLKQSALDWSFICPGPMYFANGKSAQEPLITTEFMPYEIGKWSKWLPKIFHPLIMKNRLMQMTVSYEDVAYFIMNNLRPGGPYTKKRVGLVSR